jgi:tetratricopeptide (TPR) repeat protein
MNRKINIILFTAVLLCTALARGETDLQQTYSEFTAAGDAFSKANTAQSYEESQKLYTQAILHYEKIINTGKIKNAKLYYNLANAYLLKEDIGKAILNYRRAQKLDPADADINKNLTFARQRRIDQVAVRAQKKILQTLFFWHYDFSLRVKLFTACLLFGVSCLVLTAILSFGRRAALLPTFVISLLLAIALAASVAVQSHYEQSRLCGVVITNSVTARQGDGPNYPASFKEPLHEGTEFDVVETRPGWLYIKLADDSSGWIPTNSAEII